MHKYLTIDGNSLSIYIDDEFEVRDGITGVAFKLKDGCKEWDLAPLGNRINRELSMAVYEFKEYEDCDCFAPGDPDGIGQRLVFNAEIRVFMLKCQKDNRETRRGFGKYEYKLLNVTGRRI